MNRAMKRLTLLTVTDGPALQDGFVEVKATCAGPPLETGDPDTPGPAQAKEKR